MNSALSRMEKDMRLIDADLLSGDIFKYFSQPNYHPDADAFIAMETEKHNEYIYNFLEEIEQQPTVEVPQWIPCSERLPEDLNDKNIDCFLVTDGFLIWMAYYNSEIGWQFAECTNSRNKSDWTEIIAWQQLPLPYKGK